jgi:hypothetical protein
MTLDLNLKNIVIIGSLISALIGNVFVVGKLFSDFELLKIRIAGVEESQNVLEIKQDVLELGYKIKGIKLMIDDEYRALCQKDMSKIQCK